MAKSRAKSTRVLTLQDRRDFLKLPLEARRRRMEEQAKRVERLYLTKAARKERDAWQGGDT